MHSSDATLYPGSYLYLNTRKYYQILAICDLAYQNCAGVLYMQWRRTQQKETI